VIITLYSYSGYDKLDGESDGSVALGDNEGLLGSISSRFIGL